MVGYYHQMLEGKEAELSCDGIAVIVEKPTFVKNENLQRVYKSHRDANTTHGGYIERVMCECIQVKDEDDGCGDNGDRR